MKRLAWSVWGMLALSSLGAAQTVVGRLPAPAVSLAFTDRLHALTEDGELWSLADPPVRRATGLSAEAPLSVCGAEVVAVQEGGRLWWGQPTAAVGLSESAGTLCTPGGELFAVSARGEALLIGLAGEVRRRVAVAALPDARPRLADLKGDGRPWTVLLAQPTTRYAHGVLGDGLEAASLLALDPRSLAVRARLSLPASFVFEDWEARPLRVAGRDLLAVVRSSGTGGGALTLVEWRGNALRMAAAGPDFGRGGRWLAPLTDGVKLYAVHTPHLGGALHRYDFRAGKLTATLVPGPQVSNHGLGARLVTGGVWKGAVWAGTQDGSRTLGPGVSLPSGPSSPLLATPQGAFLGTRDGQVWHLP